MKWKIFGSLINPKKILHREEIFIELLIWLCRGCVVGGLPEKKQRPTPGAVLEPCMATTTKKLLPSAYFSPYMANHPICNATRRPCQILRRRIFFHLSLFSGRQKDQRGRLHIDLEQNQHFFRNVLDAITGGNLCWVHCILLWPGKHFHWWWHPTFPLPGGHWGGVMVAGGQSEGGVMVATHATKPSCAFIWGEGRGFFTGNRNLGR